jgi:hypothetical protein
VKSNLPRLSGESRIAWELDRITVLVQLKLMACLLVQYQPRSKAVHWKSSNFIEVCTSKYIHVYLWSNRSSQHEEIWFTIACRECPVRSRINKRWMTLDPLSVTRSPTAPLNHESTMAPTNNKLSSRRTQDWWLLSAWRTVRPRDGVRCTQRRERMTIHSNGTINGWEMHYHTVVVLVNISTSIYAHRGTVVMRLW